MPIENYKIKQWIGYILYVIAIFFLVFSIYRKGKGIDDGYLDIVGWTTFLIAAFYAVWLKKSEKPS